MHHAILGRSGCRSRTEWPDEKGGRRHAGRVACPLWPSGCIGSPLVDVLLVTSEGWGLPQSRKGAKFRFLRVWGAGNGHFCPKLKWGTVLGGNLLWFHLDF